MTWFKVDDSFHAHPKVLATDAAALGLWVVAGAWSSANLTEGFVPDHVLPRLLPGADALARKLITAGLWQRTKGGYLFHSWTDYQPTREEATAARQGMSSGGTLGNHRRWHSGKGVESASCVYCQGKRDQVTDRPRDQLPDAPPESPPNPPSRPVPSLKGGDLSAPLTPGARAAPTPNCPKHQNQPAPGPCGPCADARRAWAQWDLADSERRRTAPKCRHHRGQPADNCALCRSEQLAAEELHR